MYARLEEKKAKARSLKETKARAEKRKQGFAKAREDSKKEKLLKVKNRMLVSCLPLHTTMLLVALVADRYTP